MNNDTIIRLLVSRDMLYIQTKNFLNLSCLKKRKTPKKNNCDSEDVRVICHPAGRVSHNG